MNNEQSMEKVYSVYTSGPTLSGRVALFNLHTDAVDFCRCKNEENMYSPTSTKGSDGISLAWRMGDGHYYLRQERLPISELFEWD